MLRNKGGYTSAYRPSTRRAYHYRAKIALIRAGRNILTCEVCQSTDKPEIHHIDEDYRCNEADNLQVLCKYCHYKIHGKTWV